MSPVRYPSLAHRKQTAKSRDAVMRAAVKSVAEPVVNEPPAKLVYAENLLPTLNGFVHGIVSLNPPTLQCDACGGLTSDESLNLLILSGRVRFNPRRSATDPRRLCTGCASSAWPEHAA